MNEDDLTHSRVMLRGAAGAERKFTLSSLAETQEDVSAVYVLLGRYRAGGQPTVLHVGETDDLESALAVHREYPCMQSFTDDVGWLAVESPEKRAAIAADLASHLRPTCEGCWPPASESVAPNGAPYPVSLVGGCAAECVQLDQRLREAILERRVIRFVHGNDQLEAEPLEYGLTADGVPTLFAYCTGGGAGRESAGSWNAFPLVDIHELAVTGGTARDALPTMPSPIAVILAGARQPPVELASDIADLVAGLQTQLLELRRLEARACRLRYRLRRSGGPSELAAALAEVEADQGKTREAILALIPIVAGLHRAAAGDPVA